MRYVYVVLALICSAPLAAFAVDGSGGNQFYEMVFGNPDQRKQSRDKSKDGANVGSEACDGYGGLIGGINGFFCHMEKTMGITGVGGATKTFGNFKVRAEIALASTTINSVTYTHTGSVWFCTSSCTVASSFNRFYFIAFTYDKAAGVNKGYALNIPGMMDGNVNDAMEIIYDLGSASASQTVSGKGVFTNSGTSHKMRVTGTKTSTSFKMNVAMHNGTNGFRFAMSGAPPTTTSNYYNMYYEATGGTGSGGYYSLDTAALSAIATGNGSCQLAVESGTSTQFTSGGSNCSALSFQAFDYYSLTASGSPSVQGLTASGILGTWQGMAANPSSI